MIDTIKRLATNEEVYKLSIMYKNIISEYGVCNESNMCAYFLNNLSNKGIDHGKVIFRK